LGSPCEAPDSAVPFEDLLAWTEYTNGALYRRDVLPRLHKSRVVEYDEDLEVVRISPNGVAKVEAEPLQNGVDAA
jgi:hypothetical protein